MLQCQNTIGGKRCGRILREGDRAYVQERRIITVSGKRSVIQDVEVVVCVACAG